MTDDKMIFQAVTKRPRKNANYDIGYCSPPKATRFKKGVSGNPGGRPKGSRNKPQPLGEDPLREAILREGRRVIPVSEGGRTLTMTQADAVMRALFLSAAKGSSRAQKIWLDYLTKAQKAERDEELELFAKAVEHKQYWTAVFRARARTGEEAPEVFPHPDDVIIDPRAGTVQFNGLVTKEESDYRDYVFDRKRAFEEEVKSLRRDVKKKKLRDLWPMLEKNLQQAEEQVGYFDELIVKMQGEPQDAHDIVRAFNQIKRKLQKPKKTPKNEKPAADPRG